MVPRVIPPNFNQFLATHPDTVKQAVNKPLFVFGLPRTGTTLAINLLNQDPARRCFLRWEAGDSVPPPHTEALRSDPRCLREQQIIDAMLLIWSRMKLVVEPSAATVLAAVLSQPTQFADKRVGLVLTGGNLDLQTLPWNG